MEKATNLKTTKIPVPFNIDLFFLSENDLDHLANDKEFQTTIIKESYKAIAKSIRRKSEKATLVTINNLQLSISLDKVNFETVLIKIREYFQSLEEYKECAKINNLIKQLKK